MALASSPECSYWPMPMLSVCPNCQAALTSKYCAECGQRNSELRLTASLLMRDLVESIFKVDGKLWPTLRGLFVPGFLTEEFRRGRRARYHRPIAVFFVAAGLLFSVRSCSAFQLPLEVTQGSAKHQIGDGLIKIGKGLTDMAPNAAEINEASANIVEEAKPVFDFFRSPKGLLLYALIAATILTFWFRKTGAYFSEHFVYALHVEAFAALIEAVARATTLPALRRVSTAIAFVYGVIALRRVYSLNWKQTIWQSVALLALQYAAILFIAAIAILFASIYFLRDLILA